MNFRVITKNHAADSKNKVPPKIDFRADRTHESHPTVWELSVTSTLTLVFTRTNPMHTKLFKVTCPEINLDVLKAFSLENSFLK